MDRAEAASVIEAILFVSGDPVETRAIAQALSISEDEARTALDELGSRLDYERRGLHLRRFGSKAQLSIRAEYAPYVERLLQPVQKQTLSQAALETLAIVAYRQPITRLEIEAIRGVKCDYSIQMLISRELIGEVGRKDTVGHPILYGTTDAFLAHFGIASLEELPALEPESAPDDADDMPI